jgi:uncharacterized protein YdiU (UPF0061 family)
MSFTHSFADFFSEPKFYSHTPPTPVSRPTYLAWSQDVAQLLGIKQDETWLKALSGNELLPGMRPISTRYGGHQFGHWAGQLGDGRAILLGELNQQEIQLKGAGLTPYSRRGDGRAVLRSSLREYICSEAMHFLGVPTTRALALIATGDPVMRDMFYDGNAAPESGAICVRVAESFVRFGHFEILAADGDKENLKKMLDYVLTFYPGHDGKSFFQELCTRTAKLMVEWQRVGFVHGVMNTDNMSILGLTVDYGPYGWMDVYDPDWTPNTTDREHRRYRIGQQPGVALWNLTQLARALGLLDLDLQTELEGYRTTFFAHWEKMLAHKLGLTEFPAALVRELDEILRSQETDMTLFYRELSRGMPKEAFYQTPSAEAQERLNRWYLAWRSLNPDVTLMDRTNPYFIPRNYLAQEAIDALNAGDDSKLRALELALRTPYEENAATRPFFERRPEWARTRPGCAALSCSS